jgi:SAM-dependent methyltransferase
VLDIACGDGTPVTILKERGLDAVGLDLKPLHWRGGFNFVLGNGCSLPFRDKSFNAVGCFTVLEHLEKPEQFIGEMVRVVRPGGLVVIGAPNMYGAVLFHPGGSITHTGGIPRYARNLMLHIRKYLESIFARSRVKFDTLESNITPEWITDCDAICAVDPAVVRAVLRQRGVKIKFQSPSLEYSNSRFVATITKALEFIPLLRDIFGGVFIVGVKITERERSLTSRIA